uniref:Uncharacterized protein n=1 Tax=Siphoviridae sp. ctt8434 TaxID=2825703 RepID=A0A8S5U1I1_9CAUD|nr:MAG TPA: hypothetical protein [Siphoviridae sp. ctt8434]
MKPIKAKVLCSYKGAWYEAGDEIKVETKEDLVKLNEKGFIEPLTFKDIQNFGKKEEPKKIFRKEEE